ncbi:MAG: hypothetical protein LBC60_03540 [Spirochaetaceae bacterium]|jgi:hypothetical protein|nr:hypothetical protein [Spirochaetaceae bacterium]
MNVATVLRVFKNSSLITPQGEFKISRIFRTAKAATKAGYVLHITNNDIAIYANHRGKKTARFAIIDDTPSL